MRISLKEMSAALSLGQDAINRLRKEGLPCVPKSRPIRFVPGDCIAWFLKTNRAKHASRLSATYPESTAHVKMTPIKKGDEEDLNAFLKRVRYVEMVMFDLVKNANSSQLPWAVPQHREAAEQRRKLEKDIAEIQLSQTLTMPIDDVNRKFIQAALMTKTRLTSIPNAVAGMCEGKTAAEISEILRSEIDRALEHLSDKT
jgi:hypothetical protein